MFYCDTVFHDNAMKLERNNSLKNYDNTRKLKKNSFPEDEKVRLLKMVKEKRSSVIEMNNIRIVLRSLLGCVHGYTNMLIAVNNYP